MITVGDKQRIQGSKKGKITITVLTRYVMIRETMPDKSKTATKIDQKQLVLGGVSIYAGTEVLETLN